MSTVLAAVNTADQPQPGARTRACARVFVVRSLRHSRRDVESLINAVVLPVLLMVLFTYVFGGAIGGDQQRYLTYVTPGIVLLCAGFGAASTAVAVNRDLTTGTIRRLRTMPIQPATVLVGHVVASMVRNLLATGVVIVVAVLLGYRPEAGPLGWAAAIALVALWILAITTLFTVVGLLAGSVEAANGLGFLLLFLPYVSSAFVPLDTLPSWLRGVAEHQPITPMIESIRSFFNGSGVDGSLPIALAWALAIIGVSAALAAGLFARRR